MALGIALSTVREEWSTFAMLSITEWISDMTVSKIRATYAESCITQIDRGMVWYINADKAMRRDILRNARASQSHYRSGHGFKAAPAALLTDHKSQPKLAKSIAATFGLTLAPHKAISDFILADGNIGRPINLCPAATMGCVAACLNSAGHGKFDPVQFARLVRAGFLYSDPIAAGIILAHEILSALAKHGTVRIRLNVVSDIRWEIVIPRGMAMLADMGVGFYDYTKWAPKHRAAPDFYSLTYSAHENMSDADIVALVNAGHNVAVVFGASKPAVIARVNAGATWRGIPLADGISTDDRTMDARGVIVALAALGDAVGEASGFVRPFLTDLGTIVA